MTDSTPAPDGAPLNAPAPNTPSKNSALGGADNPSDTAPLLNLRLEVPKRLTREKRWNRAMISERDELMSHARGELGLDKEAAQVWTYTQLNEKYPPLPKPTKSKKSERKTEKTPENVPYTESSIVDSTESRTETRPPAQQGDANQAPAAQPGSMDISGCVDMSRRSVVSLSFKETQSPPKVVESGKRKKTRNRNKPAEDGAVVGLNRIPSHWPPLPPNASLAAEIQWVQSVRIDIVQEMPGGGAIVRLGRAERPAPSKAALGWLETSIRSYAKYCDIAAKAAANYEDEQELVRRERMSIERVRQLLGEMVAEK